MSCHESGSCNPEEEEEKEEEREGGPATDHTGGLFASSGTITIVIESIPVLCPAKVVFPANV